MVEDNTENDAQKTCFFMEPPAVAGRKKESKNKRIGSLRSESVPYHKDTVPFVKLLGGEEPDANVEHRYSLYLRCWEKYQRIIDDVLIKANDEITDELVRYAKLPIKNKEKLNAALVFPGANIANHLRLFTHLNHKFESDPNMKTVSLKSKECINLKVTMRDIIMRLTERDQNTTNQAAAESDSEASDTDVKSENTRKSTRSRRRRRDSDSDFDMDSEEDSDDGAPAKRKKKTRVSRKFTQDSEDEEEDDEEGALNRYDKRLRYDFDILHDWCKTFSNQEDLRVILIVEDADSFDIDVLSELLDMTYSYRDLIPFKVILGIATSLEVFQEKLPRDTVRAMSGVRFDASDSEGMINELCLRVILNFDTSSFQLYPQLLRSILTRNRNSLWSVDAFVSSLKYAVMCYFYSSPLSVLHMEKHSDKLLVKSMDQYFTPIHYRTVRMLPSFKQHIEELIRDHENHQLVTKLLKDDQALKEFIVACYESIYEAKRLLVLLTRLLYRIKSYVPIIANITPIDLYLNLQEDADFQKDLQMAISSLPEEQVDSILSSKENIIQLLGSDVPKDVIQSVRHALESTLKETFIGWLKLPPPQNTPLYELFASDSSNIESNVFYPSYRSSITTALVTPNHYLNYESLALENFPPLLCTLFVLYRESSVFINVYDWYIAFRGTLQRAEIQKVLEHWAEDGLPQTSSATISPEIVAELKDKVSQESEWEKVALAWFLQSVAELKFMGIVKECKKKFECMEKVVWKDL